MLSVPRVAIALASAAFVISPAPALGGKPLVLMHATIHDGSGGPPTRDGTVVIVGERIRCVGTARRCRVPPGARTLDLAGQHLTPGLIDSHVHFSETGWIDGRPDAKMGLKLYDYDAVQRDIRSNPDRWHRAWLCSGITAVFDAGGYSWTLKYRDDTEHNLNQVHVRAAGPLLQLQPAYGRIAMGESNFLSINTDEEAVRQVRRLASLGSQAVKFRFLDPPKGQEQAMARRAMAIGREADRLGLPLIVHATLLRNAKIALRAGAEILVHSVEDELVDDEFVSLMKANNAVYVPTMRVNPNWNRFFAGVALGTLPELDDPKGLDDPNGCVDKQTRAKLQHLQRLRPELPEDRKSVHAAFAALQRAGGILAIEGANLRRLAREGVTIALGTDSGNPLTFHGPSVYAELETIEAAGIPPSQILVMATANGARAMNRSDIGTIKAGSVADMLVLREDPTVSAKAFRSLQSVIRAGVPHSPSDFAAAR